MKIICITSPIDGIISNIDNNTITIVSNNINHNIYAPSKGILINIDPMLSIQNKYLVTPISFSIEPAIRLDIKLNDTLDKGQVIGSLNIISKHIVKIFFDDLTHYKTIALGSKVLGGITMIACMIVSPDNILNNRIGGLITQMALPIYGGSDINELIILTTPHEKCIKTSEHLCDTYAEKLAKELFTILGMTKSEIILIHGTINRKFVDLNRIQGRDTKFRQEIRNKVNNFIDNAKTNHNIVYIIDCHSFPVEKHQYTFRDVRISKPEVSILFDDPIQLTLMEELTNILHDHGIAATKHMGTGNDIMDEFIHINKDDVRIVPVLIEVREDLDNDKMTLIGESVRQWIGTVNRYIFGVDK
jgi:hypothetical protein